MTPSDISTVQRSFAEVARAKGSAGKLMYDRLFQIAPELRPMFKTGQDQQAAKLVDTLGLCVSQLRYPEMVAMTLAGLGQRHAGYGARPEHYALVGEALLWTLERQLGPAFTPEVKAAWTKLYAMAAEAMIQATQRCSDAA